METTTRSILVPLDFTSLSDFALQHANNIAKVMGHTITLLHIVSSKKAEDEALRKLDEIATENTQKTGIETTKLVVTGDIYKLIPDLASDEKYALGVMKTDGVSGMQKYVGSKAIKIMRGAKNPFIVVQKAPAPIEFATIVYPIDFRTENKELLSYFFYLSKHYKLKLHLFKAKTSDKIYKKNITNNLAYTKQYLESKQMEYYIETAAGEKSYAEEVNDYANKVNADLILIQLQRNLTLTKFLFGVKEQKIIANPYKIAVMCVNPLETTVYGGFR